MTEDNYLLVNNQPVYYQLAGKGQPVVLLHGFGEDHTIWQHQVNELQDQYQLILPDLPGSGKSAATTDASMEGLAAIVYEVVQHVVPDEPFTLIGHSMGGYVALAFAAAYADRLKRLGLFHSTAYADSEEKKAMRARGIEFIREQGAAKFLEQALPNQFSAAFNKEHLQVVQEIVERYATFSAESLIQYYEAMMQRPDRTEVLRTFAGPVLFIIGEHDNTIPPKDSLAQSHLPQVSVVKILSKSAHVGMLEEITPANQALEEFLQLR